MYKLITSSKGSDDLSIGFHCDRSSRQRELTKNKNQKGTYHIRSYLKDIFAFAQHQEKATYGLGHKLTLTGNSDDSVLNKYNSTNNSKTKTYAFESHVHLYTSSIHQQAILSDQFLRKVPTEVQYVEKICFREKK